MIKCFNTKNNELMETGNREVDSLIYYKGPSKEELEEMSKIYDIDLEVIYEALEIDEPSTIEEFPHYTVVVMNVPIELYEEEAITYDIMPMVIVLLKDYTIVIANKDSNVVEGLLTKRSRYFESKSQTLLLLKILYEVDNLYMRYLRKIDKIGNQIEDRLNNFSKNHELIALMKLQKSLVYFTIALRSNEVVLEDLENERYIQQSHEIGFLEDIIILNKQAIEITINYSQLLDGMMDTFESVISNNVNIVMKILAIVTIIMAVPTMVFSAYGMNLNPVSLPFSSHPNGFFIVIGLSLILSVLVALLFIFFRDK